MAEAAGRNRFARYLPILEWLPTYQRSWLGADFIAGITIVALLVPEGLAYAQLAGMPPETAFYIAPVALLLYAIFGTSRQTVVASSSAVAVMSAATVGTLVATGTPEFIALTSMLAILAGMVSVGLGLLKLGRVANFFSESVLTGFVFGLALVIAIKQVPKLLGVEGGGEGFFERLWEIVLQLPQTHLPTLLIGAVTLALMIFLERRFHRIPAAMVALIFGIVVSALLSLENYGVEIVGALPAGLAWPQLPQVSLGDLNMLFAGALGIALISFAEAIGPAQSLARKHGYAIDPNRELIGLGGANVGAGLFQGFAVGASLSKTAANEAAGAKTQTAGIIAAGLVVIIAMFFTPIFRPLPEATLGAIVVLAVSGMLNVAELRRLYSLRRTDFMLAVVALMGVLIFDVLPGLAIAVVLSLLALVLRTSKPDVSILGRLRGRLGFADVNQTPDAQPIPGLLIVRPNEGLFFANASTLQRAIMETVRSADPKPQTLILDLEYTNELDVPANDMLIELREGLSTEETRLVLAGVRESVRAMLDKSGAMLVLGQEQIHRETLQAVVDYLGHRGAGGMEGELVILEDTIKRMIEVVERRVEHVEDVDEARLSAIRAELDALSTTIDAARETGTSVDKP